MFYVCTWWYPKQRLEYSRIANGGAEAKYASATIVRLLDLSVRPDNSAAFGNWAVFSIMQRHWAVDRRWLAIFHVRETSTSEHRDPCTLRMHAAHTLCELS